MPLILWFWLSSDENGTSRLAFPCRGMEKQELRPSKSLWIGGVCIRGAQGSLLCGKHEFIDASCPREGW